MSPRSTRGEKALPGQPTPTPEPQARPLPPRHVLSTQAPRRRTRPRRRTWPRSWPRTRPRRSRRSGRGEVTTRALRTHRFPLAPLPPHPRPSFRTPPTPPGPWHRPSFAAGRALCRLPSPARPDEPRRASAPTPTIFCAAPLLRRRHRREQHNSRVNERKGRKRTGGGVRSKACETKERKAPKACIERQESVQKGGMQSGEKGEGDLSRRPACRLVAPCRGAPLPSRRPSLSMRAALVRAPAPAPARRAGARRLRFRFADRARPGHAHSRARGLAPRSVRAARNPLGPFLRGTCEAQIGGATAEEEEKRPPPPGDCRAPARAPA